MFQKYRLCCTVALSDLKLTGTVLAEGVVKLVKTVNEHMQLVVIVKVSII